jgi:hypothetical protein
MTFMKPACPKRIRRHLLSRREVAVPQAMVLIEMIVVAALAAMVMGVVISLTVALKKRDQAIRAFGVQCTRQSELAELLRTDIRQASDVSLPAETMLVITGVDGRGSRYELTATGCRRTVTTPGEGQPGLDWFAVGPATSWTLEEGSPGQRPLFMVTLNYADSKSAKGSRQLPMLVYAALGADLPLLQLHPIR